MTKPPLHYSDEYVKSLTEQGTTVQITGKPIAYEIGGFLTGILILGIIAGTIYLWLSRL
jgi:hypothetical protein